jgi:phosphate transport system permease protein
LAEMASVASSRISLESLRGSQKRRRKEGWIRRGLFGAALLSILVSVAIMVALSGNAFAFLINVDLGALVANGWFPRRDQFDMATIFIGTILVTGVAMVVATPLGLGAAMFLAEYARPSLRRTLKPIIETLAGIPSVVIGFFALQVIQPTIAQDLLGSPSSFSLMAAGIGVGLLTIPLVATVAEDAMYAVPGALREAAYGIGARRRTVTMRVVFPAAVSGIVAALILGASRAIGETMVVAIAAGGTGGSLRTVDPLGPGQTMTGAIAALAIGSDQVRGADQAFNSLYFVGLNLFALTFLLNIVSDRFVRKVRRQY